MAKSSPKPKALTKKFLKEEFEDHLRKTLALVSIEKATSYEKFLATAYVVRDQLIERWVKTQETYQKENVKHQKRKQK